MRKKMIYLIGIGMGAEAQLTGDAIDCLGDAQAVMGAERMLESVACYSGGKEILSSYKPSEMVNWLSSFDWEAAALVLSGDTGFYSGAEAAAKAFESQGWEVEYVPGISSLSYFCARLKRSWQEVRAVSCHGREADAAANIRKWKTCFFLLGGEGSVAKFGRNLVGSGMNQVTLSVGENFSYENERILCDMTPEEMIREDEKHPFSSLVCVLAENPDAEEEKLYPAEGCRDEEFTRGHVPMTKEAVRRQIMSLLRIGGGAVCYDIGAGTGSVAVEMGLKLREKCRGGSVYAIEKKEEALELLLTNSRKFHGTWENFHIVSGEAPEAMEGLEMPTHAFIGGSGGRMMEIVKALLAANPQVRIVASAITLETVGEILACMREFHFQETEMIQISAAPVELVGGYHMPKANNPVYLAVMQYPSDEKEDIQWLDL